MMGTWPDPTYYLIRFDLFRTLMQKHDVAFVCSQQLFQASRQALEMVALQMACRYGFHKNVNRIKQYYSITGHQIGPNEGGNY